MGAVPSGTGTGTGTGTMVITYSQINATAIFPNYPPNEDIFPDSAGNVAHSLVPYRCSQFGLLFSPLKHFSEISFSRNPDLCDDVPARSVTAGREVPAHPETCCGPRYEHDYSGLSAFLLVISCPSYGPPGDPGRSRSRYSSCLRNLHGPNDILNYEEHSLSLAGEKGYVPCPQPAGEKGYVPCVSKSEYTKNRVNRITFTWPNVILDYEEHSLSLAGEKGYVPCVSKSESAQEPVACGRGLPLFHRVNLSGREAIVIETFNKKDNGEVEVQGRKLRRLWTPRGSDLSLTWKLELSCLWVNPGQSSTEHQCEVEVQGRKLRRLWTPRGSDLSLTWKLELSCLWVNPGQSSTEHQCEVEVQGRKLLRLWTPRGSDLSLTWKFELSCLTEFYRKPIRGGGTRPQVNAVVDTSRLRSQPDLELFCLWVNPGQSSTENQCKVEVHGRKLRRLWTSRSSDLSLTWKLELSCLWVNPGQSSTEHQCTDKSIAQSLHEQEMAALSRSESRASLVSMGSTTSQEIARITTNQRHLPTSSPGDLHGMWYPPVRRTLVCLSRLYRCIERPIFQGLSQEALTMCIQSINNAADTIKTNK
ncbi:Golgi transport complex subunit 3, partial [Homalodisca vitripennis]